MYKHFFFPAILILLITSCTNIEDDTQEIGNTKALIKTIKKRYKGVETIGNPTPIHESSPTGGPIIHSTSNEDLTYNKNALSYSFVRTIETPERNDLFENFFIRLSRGSWLKGLFSLDKKSKINNKNLIRPLINEKKEDLIYISKKVFNFYVQDPSNLDEKFKRIRIRKLINELQKDGLDKSKFLKTIKNLKYSNKVVDF